ncbi:hypothetical protein [Hymenobacter busanensis]|nr:hypothetical protein [Hymenobacter busanensis]QHJ06366.1 hypothetical protein GUY19_03255 [Hymenobacter busanensis]
MTTAQTVLLMIMGTRNDTPQWELRLDINDKVYKALKRLKLPDEQAILNGEPVPNTYLMYMTEDADVYNVWKIVQDWPRTHWYKAKVMKYMKGRGSVLP